MTLKQLIEESDTWAGRKFDLAIQALILVSLVTFSIETIPELSSETRYWLHVVEVFTVAVFTIEYALRFYVADNRLRFTFSFYGLIDLLAILPFYISTGVDLRAIRVIRLFRIFRILKFLRYTRAINRLSRAAYEIREEMILYLLATSIFLFLASVGIYYFERDTQPEQFGSVFHCLWWSVITLTTVGYGDAYPLTLGGRIFTGVILLLGIGIIAVPTGLFASALTKTRRDAEDEDLE